MRETYFKSELVYYDLADGKQEVWINHSKMRVRIPKELGLEVQSLPSRLQSGDPLPESFEQLCSLGIYSTQPTGKVHPILKWMNAFHWQATPPKQPIEEYLDLKEKIASSTNEPRGKIVGPLIAAELTVQELKPSLSELFQSRQTTRNFLDTPIRFEQISDFCLHTIPRPQETPAYKPYPSGGGLYSLVFELLIREGSGIQKGVYRYFPQSRCFQKMAHREEEFEFAFDLAMGSTAPQLNRKPQAMILISADLALVSQRYGEQSLSLALKEVGAYNQTAYLVAPPLGLGVCALGRTLGGKTQKLIIERENHQELDPVGVLCLGVK